MIAPLRIRDLIAMLVWLWRNPHLAAPKETTWHDTRPPKQKSDALSRKE
jgi:hypothetical protein